MLDIKHLKTIKTIQECGSLVEAAVFGERVGEVGAPRGVRRLVGHQI